MNRAEDAIERGLAKSRDDDWDGAAEAFRRAVCLGPQNPEAHYRLGWALFRKAESIKPSLADLSVGYLAQLTGFDNVARDRGRKFGAHRRVLTESCHWFREAVSRDPEHARAHYHLAMALRELGYRSEAAASARSAADLEPSNARYGELVAACTHDASGSEPAATAEAGPRMTWDDLVLAPKTKRELRQVQAMLENPDLAMDLGVQAPTGILLKGAPGTGKTTIARVLAQEANCRFFVVSAAEINQMYVGESEKRVRDLFEKARAEAPAIVFLDEIDALLPARQGGMAVHSDKVVNQFLQEMDGMQPNHRVLVLGATNRADMLDPAVRRGGRLSREIEIPLPDQAARIQLLGLFTQGARLGEDVDIQRLAEATDGWSGADLRAAVNEAGLQALVRLSENPDASPDRLITAADFAEALANLQETG